MESSVKILEAIGQLKVGGLVVIALAVICALIAWMLWLRNRRAEQQAASLASVAESRAKEKRADRYTAALENLRVEIETMRKDNGKGSQAIQSLVTQQTSTLTQTVTALEIGHNQRQSELSVLMRELLDRHKGVINIEDSLRIVELNFRSEVKIPVLSTVEASVRNNHYGNNAVFVQERFLARVNQILFTAQEALKFYALSLDTRFFYPSDAEKHYQLADTLWQSLKAIHETPADLSSDVVVAQRVQQAQIRAENIINSFINAKVTKIRANDSDDGVAPASAG